MEGLERPLKLLRSFIETMAWDYCVVWKLGDDPSRFIEWMDCCCTGGNSHGNIKQEKGTEQYISSLCRDLHVRHPIRTKACESLVRFPPFMPLYSGIHGEVVISNIPRWLSPPPNALYSNPSDEADGTRVLIPIIGGLIELFAGKHIPRDQQTIDFIIANCNLSSEQEAIMTIQRYPNLRLTEPHIDLVLDNHSQNCPPPIHKIPPPVTQICTNHSFEVSSSGSTPSNENPLFDSCSFQLSPSILLMQSIDPSLRSEKPKYQDSLSKKRMDLSSACDKRLVRNDGEKFQAKNIQSERNRRGRIKDGLFRLRALVPKISKMDRTSILVDAIDYIGELQSMVKEIQDELKEMDDNCNKNNLALKVPKGIQRGSLDLPTTDHNQSSSSIGEKKPMEVQVQVEVNQIGARDFLLKFLCEHRRGGFARLMEILNYLGLQVIDANVTTFDGKVLNVLKVEATKEILPDKLKYSLIRLTSSTIRHP